MDDRGGGRHDQSRSEDGLMPGQGSWPYLPAQCPRCWYFQEFAPFVDDSGYEIVGFCRHPRIGMELFVPQRRELSESDRCPWFLPDVNA